jgi:P-type Ca2+ transporter type 2C
MSTVIQNATGNGDYDKRLFIKGASELVLAACDTYLNDKGDVCPIQDDTRKQVQDIISTYAKQALRTICIGYRDL